jgi:hypothetical protein
VSDASRSNESVESIVRATRVTATLLLAAPLAVVVLAPASHALEIPEPLVALVSLAGFIAPVVALHRYRAAEESILAGATRIERARSLRAATLVWLAMSAAVAGVGALAYLCGADLRVCSGSVLHLLVGAAIWPTAARVERLVERAADTA